MDQDGKTCIEKLCSLALEMMPAIFGFLNVSEQRWENMDGKNITSLVLISSGFHVCGESNMCKEDKMF